jgi:hypothetical protein
MLLSEREVGQGGRIVLDVRDTKKKLIPPVTPPVIPPVVCRWYAADDSTFLETSDYLPFDSFAAALAATAGFVSPMLVWGSVDAIVNYDGSAPYVKIGYRPVSFPNPAMWLWSIGIIGTPDVDNGSTLLTAQVALSEVEASAFLPAGFCT